MCEIVRVIKCDFERLENEGFSDAPGLYSIVQKGHTTKAKQTNGDYWEGV